MVGANPNGSSYDLKTGKKSEYADAKENAANVPVPEFDPMMGKREGVPEIWNAM